MKQKQLWISFVVFILLCLIVQIVGSFWTKETVSTWYPTLAMLYGGQLALNFIWSFLFFSLRSPTLGLIDIVLLCLLISLTIIKAWPVRPLASLLLIPYLIWVIYATSLNAGIWLLNYASRLGLVGS